jgi:CSLREA domain-containing protein
MLPKSLSSSRRVSSSRYQLLFGLLAAAAFLCLRAAPWRVRAATTWTVTTTADSGAGSLRKAIADAADGDTINFNLSGCPCTITLTTGQLVIGKNLTIKGPGAGVLTVSCNNSSRVFRIFGFSVLIDGLTVTGGNGVGTGELPPTFGGGIRQEGGTLTLVNTIVSGNFANFGGGIMTGNTLTLNNTTVSGNTATGCGGILNFGGTVTLNNSTVSGNAATGSVGGIDNNASGSPGTLTITNSTISGNSAAGGEGGAIRNFGPLTITNSTISGNSATSDGGAIINRSGMTILNSTLTANRADSDGNSGGLGGGIGAFSNETLNNTIVAGNFRGAGSTSDDISGGTVNTANNNLIGDAGTSGAINDGVSGNKVGFAVGAVLNTTLANNGGPTKTHALVPGSAALDAGSNSLAAGLTTDQRGPGFPRVGNATVDIGAFEGTLRVVTKTADTNDGTCDADCSLREAIATASPGDTVLFSSLFNSPQTITLGSGELFINKNLQVLGTGADKLTISGNNVSRVFRIGSGVTATLDGLTISGGNALSAPVVSGGGGIYNGGGTLMLTSSSVSGNTASFGGGILNESGTLVVTSSTVSGNSGSLGGGLRSVTNPNIGGFGRVTIINSTFSGNSADTDGGGIYNSNLLTITNSTFTGNRADSDGSGGGTGGGIDGGGPDTLNNTIVAGNFRGTGSTPDDISGTIDVRNNNLIGDAATSGGITNGVNGNKVGFAVAAVLNTTLAFNGGPTKTHALIGCSSPAVNAGSNTLAVDGANALLTTDQRGLGFQRKFAGATDIGAFELQTFCNTPPTAVADTYTTAEDTPLNVAASGVLGNDSDPDAGDSITALLVSGPSNAASFTLNANGSFNYTPNSNFNGSDSFSYKARDNNNADSNTVTVAITVTPVNDSPTAVDDTANTNEDTSVGVIVLAIDSDVDGDSLTVSSVTQPAHGSAAINPDGTITYSPNANFNGSDSFTYNVDDGHSGSASATVQINVAPVNDAPVAVADSYSTNEDTPITAVVPGVLGNDSDVDGNALSAFLVSGPSHGTVSFNSNGSFTYTPAANYNGPDSFTYKANDGSVDSNVATVSITVNAVNDAPTVVVAPGGSCSDTTIISGTMNLIVGDIETPASSLTLSGSSNNTALVPNANIVLGGSGANRTITITVVPKKTGTATITVGVSDGQATGVVTITVIVGSDKNETLNGTAGADMIFGLGGKNTINGNAGNDLICGGNGFDTISGGDGDDTIEGGNGDDVIKGDAGNDILIGGAGNDRLEGGADNDLLTGGSGADAFFGGTGTDAVSDFTPSQGDTQNGIP